MEETPEKKGLLKAIKSHFEASFVSRCLITETQTILKNLIS